ncbi:tubulin-folding cofactor B [Scophthalmus maximus]|uniref:tubulin-folding cofactor B n=1 Tax=Scophthalmus maximus TaxID=52904 RepID=UPI001FA88CB2|nr:tubulin-folding cofactor B [Scophthalmus maximus]
MLASSSSATSVRSWRSSQGPHRVFVPHSPVDLQPGHRVRVMLPSGRISTGTVRFLGHLQGEADLHLGVELQTPDHGRHDGSHRGHSYFECMPGYGAFVPFHKLLMAWE